MRFFPALLMASVLVSRASGQGLPNTPTMTIYGNPGYYAVAAYPDGNHAVTAGTDGSLRIWNLSNGSLERILTGHRGIVYTVAVSSDGASIVSGGQDSTIRIWQSLDGALIRAIPAGSVVRSVAISPNGQTIVSGGFDYAVKVWQASTGSLLRTLTDHTKVVYSIAISSDGTTIVSGSDDRTAKVWDLATGQLLRTVGGHFYGVWAVAVNPEGTIGISATANGTIKTWLTATGATLDSIPAGGTGHTGAVWSIAVTPDSQKFVSGSYDQTIKVWELGTGTLLRTLPVGTDAGHANFIQGIALTPNGETIISASLDRTVKTWRLSDGALMQTLVPATAGHAGSVNAVYVSPDGQTLISGSSDFTLKMWQATDGTLVRTLPVGADAGHAGDVWSLAMTSDGDTIISGGYDGAIKLWRASNGGLVRTLPVGADVGHEYSVYSIALSPDGKTLASGSGDLTIKLWRMSDGALLNTLPVGGGNVDDRSVWGVAFGADGQQVVSAGGEGFIKVWQVSDGALLRTLPLAGDQGHNGDVGCVAVTPDGQTIISGSADGTVKVWRYSDGALLQTLPIGADIGHTATIWRVIVTGDGQNIISASDDCTIKIWRLSDGALLRTLTGHTGSVWGLAVSPDGQTLVSGGSDDLTVRTWKLAEPQGETTVFGTITTRTWYKANSPYRVSGEITVPNGETLTIQPGVDVLFDADVDFTVAGRIIATGTDTDSIRFLSGATEWGGFSINGSVDTSRFTYVRFSGARANAHQYDGDGAMHIYASKVVLEHCVVSGNSSTYCGGGMGLDMAAEVWIRDCAVVDNSCGHDGGGIYSARSTLHMQRSILARNDAGGTGDGIMVGFDSVVDFVNCTVAGNGGAAFAIYPAGVNTVLNSIVWGNGSVGAITSMQYTNTSVDPLFVDAANGDYRLQAGSPCIDAGDPSTFDPDGTRADMGAKPTTQPGTGVAGIVETALWTKANSPYRVTSAITVPAGNTLTVEPGVDVLFNADAQFIVLGSLHAVGTPQDSIRFLKGTAAEWGGIRISGGDSSSVAYARISGGNANNISPGDVGGGISLSGAATRLRLANSVVTGNLATGKGGGVAVSSATVLWMNASKIAGNSTPGSGGGLSVDGGAASMVDCGVSGNTGTTSGGGLWVGNGSLTATSCEISGNVSSHTGGADITIGGTASFTRCVIHHNTGAGLLGGVASYSNAGTSLVNCVVSENSTTSGTAGGIYAESSPVVLKNTVVWGNNAANIVGAGLVTATYSNVQNSWPGTGNIDANPLFVNAAAGDFHVLAGSPCVDAGDPASALDPDGTRADMGAFPTFQSRLTLPDIAAYSGDWAEGTVTGSVQAAGVDIAFLVSPSVVDSVKVLWSPFSDAEVNVFGDTVFVGLSNATGPTLSDTTVVKLGFKLKASATPQVTALAWVPYPETAVDEGPAVLTDGTLQVLNRRPEWSVRADTAASPLLTLEFSVEATDGDGHGLTYEMVDFPRSAQFQMSTRTFSWQPVFEQAGDTLVVFSVTDGFDVVNDTLNISVWDYYGDVTLDSTVSALDASKALQYSVHLPVAITEEVADVSNNGTVTAYDAGLILYKLIYPGFVFPVRAVGTKSAKPVQAAPRALAFVRDGGGWNLVVSDPDGILGCDLTLSVPEGANAAFSGDGAVECAVDGQTVHVGIARAEFSNPVLLHVTGALPVIQAASLNEGAIPSMLSAPVPFSLAQNTPNPFNPSTTLRFGLPEAGHVRLAVYDVTGSVVRTLVDGHVEAGMREVAWDGRDANGREVASGVYVYRLTAKQGVVTRRMTLAR
jgi:WD40 repeat protein